jgi:hypothetical protein
MSWPSAGVSGHLALNGVLAHKPHQTLPDSRLRNFQGIRHFQHGQWSRDPQQAQQAAV